MRMEALSPTARTLLVLLLVLGGLGIAAAGYYAYSTSDEAQWREIRAGVERARAHHH